MELLLIFCRRCKSGFCVCRSCWRGQAYCCDACRTVSRLESRRKAQQRYRQTEKGKRAHRLSENRRRYRKNNSPSKNMDDTTSSPSLDGGIVSSQRENIAILNPGLHDCCNFCGRPGKIVPYFPRRGYN